MSSSDLIFIDPLLGADDTWSGYRVEFAPGNANPAVLAHLCESPLVSEFDRRHPWFIPALPGGPIKCPLGAPPVTVFPAQPAAQDAEALAQLESSLRQARGKLGLLASPDGKLPGAGSWEYLVIGASQARTLPPFTLLGLASRTILVATNVPNHNDRNWLLEHAFSLSSSEFLLTRLSNGSKADMTRLHLLELLTLIVADADTGALEEVFRKEPKLSYSLLRLVNSAAIAPRSPITGFAQAINLLGRRQLQRWLQLLVYADPNNGQHPNPLLQKAAVRGRLLEVLASSLTSRPPVENLEDAAFMIGTFSLLDVLLNMSMQEILQQLPLSDVVRTALAEYGGPLGQLLRALNSADGRDLKSAARALTEQGIAGDTFLAAQLQALSWASKIRPAA